jgi:hypothetical protein
MGAINSFIAAADRTSAKWLLWVGLYEVLGIFVPWIMTRTWAHQQGIDLRPNPKQLFRDGTLGLVSLIVAISVIWDLQKSQYMPPAIALGSVVLAVLGIMAASVWIEAYCRQTTRTRYSPQRAWRDSRSLAFVVFSVATVTEILLDRLAKAVVLR